MPRLENPVVFKNVVRSTYNLKGDVKDVEQVVSTKPVVAYYNSADPLPENPKEALKTLKKLTLDVEEIKDFTDGEAKFLMKIYPWLEFAGNKAVKAGNGELAKMELDMLKEQAGAKARNQDENITVVLPD